MRTRVQEPLLKPELNNELGATERRKTHTAPRELFSFSDSFWQGAAEQLYTANIYIKLQARLIATEQSVDCVYVLHANPAADESRLELHERIIRAGKPTERMRLYVRHCIALITRHIRHPLFVGMQLDDQFAFVSATPLNARWIWMDGSVNLLGRCCVYCMARRSYLCALCISSVMHRVPNQSWAGHFSLFARTTYCTL